MRSASLDFRTLLRHLFVAGLVFAIPLAVQAETLQCQAGSVAVGDTMAAVGSRCGPPSAVGSYCAPVEIQWVDRSRYAPYGRWLAPCQPVDEWVYDRGVGYLPARLQFRGGRLWSLVYGQSAP